MKIAPKTPYFQITFLLLVSLTFAASASGLLELGSGSLAGFRLREAWIEAVLRTGTLPPVMKSVEFGVLLLSGAVLSVLLPVLTPVRASALTAVAILPPFYFNYANPGGLELLPMEFTLIMIGVLFISHVLVTYFVQTHAKQQIIDVFGQYVPPSLVADIARHPDEIDLEGEARRLSVFFCDLQDFSGISEQLNPRQLTRLLNEYFTAMTEILFRHGATIDKYIGDSIMAFWGAPVPVPDHARRAVLASFEMHDRIRELAAEFVKRGWPGPTMGIGANTGMMNVGNMGSEYRIAYTVVGDAVNLASRLETLTRTYQVPTIVSDAMKAECGGIRFRTLDVVQVRGKVNRTTIFQPIALEEALGEERRRELDRHEAAMEHYINDRFDEALGMFRELNTEYGADPYYGVMCRRIGDAAKN